MKDSKYHVYQKKIYVNLYQVTSRNVLHDTECKIQCISRNVLSVGDAEHAGHEIVGQASF